MHQNRKQDRIIESIVGVVVLLVAIGAIGCACYFFLKSQRSRDWPSVEGMITKSSTRIQREPGTSGTPTTIADVWYTFVIDGVAYQNNTISLAQYGSSSASHAVKEAHRYPVGSKVMVYYNPENFHDAILEHKTPWIFIGIFAGLGSILFYIAIVMLSGRSGTNHYAAARWHPKPLSYDERKRPGAAGWRMMMVVITLSAFTAGLGLYVLIKDKALNREDSSQTDTFRPEQFQPQLISTYSSTETSPPCKEWLKPNVAKSQKIHLKDNVYTLYATATLCIDEEEMKAASQTHRTWPIIANQLATYDKSLFDPEPSVEELEFKLRRVEQECLAQLKKEDISFVKAIKFQNLQVFNEN